MARGNERQKIVRDDGDRRRLVEGLEGPVLRCGWELLCYVIMGSHLHLLLQTPTPVPSPFRDAFGGWILGSARVDRRNARGRADQRPFRFRLGRSLALPG